jgi:hypothetical protein
MAYSRGLVFQPLFLTARCDILPRYLLSRRESANELQKLFLFYYGEETLARGLKR